MKYPMYSIRDLKTTFQSPMLAMNDSDAIRSFDSLVRFEAPYKHHPQDFQLFRVGEFDLESGLILPEQPAFLIYDGGSYAS